MDGQHEVKLSRKTMVEVGGGRYQQQKVFLLSTPQDVDSWRQTSCFCLGQSKQFCPRGLRNWDSHEKGLRCPHITPVIPEPPCPHISLILIFPFTIRLFLENTSVFFFSLSDPLSLLLGCSSVSCPHFPQFVLKLTLFRLTVAVPHWPWCGYLSGLSLFFSTGENSRDCSEC